MPLFLTVFLSGCLPACRPAGLCFCLSLVYVPMYLAFARMGALLRSLVCQRLCFFFCRFISTQTFYNATAGYLARLACSTPLVPFGRACLSSQRALYHSTRPAHALPTYEHHSAASKPFTDASRASSSLLCVCMFSIARACFKIVLLHDNISIQ